MMSKLPINVARVSEGFKVGMSKKLIYTALAVVCVVIGLIGLVIPVIPGLLFLIGAVMLLSQVSGRVKQWSEGQPWMHQVRVRMIQLGGLKPLEKTRFILLLGVKNLMDALDKSWQTIRRFINR